MEADWPLHGVSEELDKLQMLQIREMNKAHGLQGCTDGSGRRCFFPLRTCRNLRGASPKDIHPLQPSPTKGQEHELRRHPFLTPPLEPLSGQLTSLGSGEGARADANDGAEAFARGSPMPASDTGATLVGGCRNLRFTSK